LPRTTFRSDRRRFLALALTALLVGSASARAAPIDRFFPVTPPDGAVAGPNPTFVIGYATRDAADDPRELRFGITLEPLRDAGQRYVFDQDSKPGWLHGDAGQVIFRPRRPLADGAYRWRPRIWTGTEWRTGEAFALRVDSVPPADVSGMRVGIDPSDGAVLLRWTPVTLDRDGRPEYVERYHVYRYETGVSLPVIRTFEIGTTVEPGFVDRSDPPPDATILFYKVTAEDEAGNEPERR